MDPVESEGLIPWDYRCSVLEATVALADLVLALTDIEKRWAEEDLNNLEFILLPRLEVTWSKIFRALNASRLTFPKFHELRHMPRLIRLYGNPGNFDTGNRHLYLILLKLFLGTFESFHRFAVKYTYSRFNLKREKKSLEMFELIRTQRLIMIQNEKARSDARLRASLEKHRVNPEDTEWVQFPDFMLLSDFKKEYGEVEARFLLSLIEQLPQQEEDIVENRLRQLILLNSGRVKFATSVTIRSSVDDHHSIGVLRADPQFRKKQRYDCIEINHAGKEKWFARLRTFVRMKVDEGVYEHYCIVETMECVKPEQLNSLHRILDCFVVDCSSPDVHLVPVHAIKRRVKLVPDFSSCLSGKWTEPSRLIVDRFDKLTLRYQDEDLGSEEEEDNE